MMDKIQQEKDEIQVLQPLVSRTRSLALFTHLILRRIYDSRRSVGTHPYIEEVGVEEASVHE